MNKKYKLLVGMSILLIITFFVMLVIDYINYDGITNSAPFSAYILIRTIEFIIPSVILLLVAKFLKASR